MIVTWANEGYRPGRGTPPKNWVRMCGTHLKTLTLFMTRICNFAYPIYDQSLQFSLPSYEQYLGISLPHLWPDQKLDTLYHPSDKVCFASVSDVASWFPGSEAINEIQIRCGKCHKVHMINRPRYGKHFGDSKCSFLYVKAKMHLFFDS